MIESGSGEEARMAITAFKEKRKPVFHEENDSIKGCSN